MPSAAWLNGWVAGDIVTAAELKKSMGSVFNTTLGAPATSIDTGAVLPTSYAHMFVEISARSDLAAASSSLSVRMNNDSAANYVFETLAGANAVASAVVPAAGTSFTIGSIPANTASAGWFGTGLLWLPNYGSANIKAVFSIGGGAFSGVTGTVSLQGGVWNAGSAINQLTFLSGGTNFATGTRVTVYVMGS